MWLTPFLLLLLPIFFCMDTWAQSTGDNSGYIPLGPVIKIINESTFDFSDVPEGKEISHKFVFVNEGDAPLVITEVMNTRTNANAEWTKAPVLPGKKGMIIIYTDTKETEGSFKRTFYIRSNAANNTCGLGYELIIKGYVNPLATPETVKE